MPPPAFPPIEKPIPAPKVHVNEKLLKSFYISKFLRLLPAPAPPPAPAPAPPSIFKVIKIQ